MVVVNKFSKRMSTHMFYNAVPLRLRDYGRWLKGSRLQKKKWKCKCLEELDNGNPNTTCRLVQMTQSHHEKVFKIKYSNP